MAFLCRQPSPYRHNDLTSDGVQHSKKLGIRIRASFSGRSLLLLSMTARPVHADILEFGAFVPPSLLTTKITSNGKRRSSQKMG